MKVLQYLNQQYKSTKWPYFNSMKIVSMFGEEGRKELNELKENGIIKRRAGANAPLVQLLVTEDGEVIKQ